MTETLRVPYDEDAQLAAELMSEYSPEPVTEETVLLAWASPSLDRQQDTRLSGSCYVSVEGLGEERVWLDIHGRPHDELLEWAEARAAEKGRRIFTGAWLQNEPVLDELGKRGFKLVRHSYRMAIDLTEATPSAEWPNGILTRPFQPGDERTFYDVHEETFEDIWENVSEPYEEWSHWLLQPPRFVPELWFLALDGEVPAGIAICYPHPGNPELGWVGILGVRRPWRRRGLGRALLLHAFAEFRSRALPRGGLGVDAESLTGAHRLYESAGMHVADRFDVYEKTL